MTLMVVYWGWSFWVAAPIAGLITGLVGIIVGLPSLRIKGFYLALATVALVVIHVCLHWTWVCHTACRLAGLNVTSPQRCRLWGTLLLVLLIALTIAALYLAKTQVR